MVFKKWTITEQGFNRYLHWAIAASMKETEATVTSTTEVSKTNKLI